MRDKPLSLYFLTLLFLALAIGMPLQIIALYNYGIDQMDLVYHNLTPLNMIVVTLGLLSAYLVFIASKYALGSILVLTLAVVWNNLFVGLAGFDFSIWDTSLGSALFSLGVGGALASGAYRVLSDRKNQWWKTAQRYRLEYPLTVRPLVGDKYDIKTFDISESGCFAKLPVEQVENIKEGEFVTIQLAFDTYKVFRCEGEVVRMSKGDGRYPEGLGIRFKTIDSENKQVLSSEIFC